MGRVLGVDPGSHRVGLAMSDPLGIAATPLEVIDAGETVVEHVRNLVEEHAVTCVVVGLPVNLNGTEGPSAVAARDLARRISDEVDVDVQLWDERFTTKTAEAALLEGNVKRKARRQLVDKVAAAVMLQQWLDAH